jgi:hypothetical protein
VLRRDGESGRVGLLLHGFSATGGGASLLLIFSRTKKVAAMRAITARSVKIGLLNDGFFFTAMLFLRGFAKAVLREVRILSPL